jgi:hypothetical protein
MNGLKYHDKFRLAVDSVEAQWIGVNKYRSPPHKFTIHTPHVEETTRRLKAILKPYSHSFVDCGHEEAIAYMSHMSTSSGWPNNSIVGQTCKWALEHADELLAWWDTGPFGTILYSGFSKIEIRLKGKPVRQVNAGDVFMLYAQIRLFKRYTDTSSGDSDHLDNILIGWDPYYGGWANMMAYLNNDPDSSDDVVCADMRRQDSMMCPFVMEEIYRIRREYGQFSYSHHCQQWFKFVLKTTINTFVRMRTGEVFIKTHGNPSGSKLTSRDSSEYSLWCVLYDQVANGISYRYQILGDNVIMNRDYDQFCKTFSDRDLNLNYTNEDGVFLGRRDARRVTDTGFIIDSFFPAEFDKHVCNMLNAKTDILKHVSGIINLADLYALSYTHWKFFNDYYDLLMARLSLSGIDTIVHNSGLRMKSYSESLSMHRVQH